MKEPEEPQSKISQQNTWKDLSSEKPHDIFNFLDKDTSGFNTLDAGCIKGLGGQLPDMQGEDYEEQDFANRMKKKRKCHKR